MSLTLSHPRQSEGLVAFSLCVYAAHLILVPVTFVARDRNTGKGAPINRLLPQTEFEQELFAAADARAAAKKAERSLSAAAKAEAAQQRQAEVDAMMTAARPFFSLPALAPKHTFPMARTKLTNTLITEPQHQNTAGRVFGGFLMRRAFELAFACCYVFVRQ